MISASACKRDSERDTMASLRVGSLAACRRGVEIHIQALKNECGTEQDGWLRLNKHGRVGKRILDL